MMIKKLVISYSTDDRTIATTVRDQLAKGGYEVWIAHDDIRGSVDWTTTILNTIDNRDGLVLIWSKNAAKSEDVREEIRLARVLGRPIFPIHAHPNEEVPSLPYEINFLQVIHMGSLDLNIAELKERLADPNKTEIQYPELAENGYISKSRNPFFKGRDRELMDLFVDSRGYRGVTRKGVPIAVTGLAGIGKTQLVLTFAYRFNIFFPAGVYWVNVESGIVNEFSKIGHHLGVKEFRDERPRDYANRVREKLSQLRDGLIIFDNVASFSEFHEWCPQGSASCSVILTTRLSPRGFPTRVMNLAELDSDSAYDLLIARRPDGLEISRDEVQREALKEICRITGNYPLALELCACRIQSEFIKPSDYLSDIHLDPLGQPSEDKDLDLFLDVRTSNLRAVLFHSYASLDVELVNPYFLLMCCFSPYGINRELITQAYGKPVEGGRALGQLDNISFIRREFSNTLSLHPLVAQFGRGLQERKGFDYSRKFVEIMLGFLQSHHNNLASDDVRRERSHIDEALRVAQDKMLWEECATLHEYKSVIEVGIHEKIESLNKTHYIIEQYLPDQKRRLLNLRLQLGKTHRTAGQLHEALTDFNVAEDLYIKVGDIDPAEAASLGFELGDICLVLGQFAKAEKILSEALKVASAVLDNSAPEILQLRQALAKHALQIGEYDTADVNLSRILEDRRKFYLTQPDATSALGLATAHADLSRLALVRAQYADALQATTEALKITQEYYDEHDPNCSALYLLLGTIYYESGNYGLAEKRLDTARRDFLAAYGERHPNYAGALIKLGEVHRKQGEFDKAEEEVNRAIEILEHIYGKNQPSVAEALAVQGKIYDHLGEFTKEELIWERILEIQRQFYAEQHPALADTHYNYASFFMRKGEYSKAAEHLQSSLKITEQNFGKTHADYIGCLIRLATCRYEQQEYSQAQDILNNAKGLQRTVFGDALHPYIARTIQLQSEILRRQGRFNEALEIIDQAIAMKKAIYGTEEHPSVANAFEEKAKIYHHLGEKIDAKLLIDRTLEIRQKTYGENHSEVSRSIHDLGSYYLRLGQYAEAIRQFEQARKITATVFGRNHPDYVERSLNLASAHYERGDYQLALDLVGEIEAALPEGDHYLKARWLQLMGELQRRTGQFKTAMDYINQAIAMKTAIYGTENHPSIAEALDVQGKIYDHLGEFDEEEKVWKKILEIQNKSYSPQHPALATTYYNYASFFMRKGEYSKAAEHLQSSLKITEQNFGKTHTEYFGRLIRLATCRYEQQEYSQAQDILNNAKGLQRTVFGDALHPYIARMIQLQSEILRRQGRFNEALEIIDQAITMKKAIYGTEEHPSVAEALEVKVRIFHHLGKGPEAERLIKQTLEIRQKTYGENHPEVSRSIHDLGSYYLRLGQYAEAIRQFEQARKITATVFGRNHPDYVERSLNLANAHYERGDYQLALYLIGEIEAALPEGDHYLKARWLQLMGELQRRLGRFDKAKEYIEKVITMKKAIYGKQDHPSVAEALDILGKIYDHLCEFDEEEKIWEQVLKIQVAYYSDQHPALAVTHYNYASLFLRKGEYGKAAEHLQLSLKITEQNFGKTHTEYFGRLIRLATCRYEQQEYGSAQELLDEAEKLRSGTFGDSVHPYIARMYQLQSEILRRQGRFNEALEIIDQAITMKKAIYGTEEHPSVAEAFGLQVALFLDQYELSKCNELLDTVERIRANVYGKSHPEYAGYQMLRSQWYLKSGEYDQAIVILKQSLDICLKIFSLNHPETIMRKVELARLNRILNDTAGAELWIKDLLATLGSRFEKDDSLIVSEVYQVRAYIRRVQGKYAESLLDLEKALSIKTKIFQPESPSVMELQIQKVRSLIAFYQLDDATKVVENALHQIESNQSLYKLLRSDLLAQSGILHDYRGEYDDGIRNIEEAIQLRIQLLGDKNIELARLYVEKAVILRHQDKYNEALIELENAQYIDNLYLRENHLDFARILLEQGQTYVCKKSIDVAQEHLKEAIKIYISQPYQSVRQHADASEALGQIYLETGFLHEADKLFQKAMEIRIAIFGNSHPKIAIILVRQAQVFLKMTETTKNQDTKDKARQNIDRAQIMLGQSEKDSTLQVQLSEVKRALDSL